MMKFQVLLPFGEIDLRLRLLGLCDANQFNKHLKSVYGGPGEKTASDFKELRFQWQEQICKQTIAIWKSKYCERGKHRA